MNQHSRRIADFQDRIFKLRHYRITALGERIQSLQVKLEQSERAASGKGFRLRKGEGIGAILKVVSGPDGLGLSQVQIAEKTGISASTVYRLLTKNPDRFVLGQDNLWRKKG